MPRKHREIKAGLAAKGFLIDQQRRHVVFVYKDLQGRTTTARTLLSHGAGGNDIGDNLLGQMARQVGLDRKDFLRLIDCPMSREDFDVIMVERDSTEQES
jgi:hypothetical protein